MATVTDSNLCIRRKHNHRRNHIEKAGILPYEQVMVSNLNNGERFETYVIPGKAGKGDICLNGPTARKGAVGDKVIIFCYSYFDRSEIKGFKPNIIRLDQNNRIVKEKSSKQ